VIHEPITRYPEYHRRIADAIELGRFDMEHYWHQIAVGKRLQLRPFPWTAKSNIVPMRRKA